MVTDGAANGTVSCASLVPPDSPAAAAGLRADEWLRSALAPIGGKGGGTAASAQGKGTYDAPGLDAVVAAGNRFVVSLPRP